MMQLAAPAHCPQHLTLMQVLGRRVQPTVAAWHCCRPPCTESSPEHAPLAAGRAAGTGALLTGRPTGTLRPGAAAAADALEGPKGTAAAAWGAFGGATSLILRVTSVCQVACWRGPLGPGSILCLSQSSQGCLAAVPGAPAPSSLPAFHPCLALTAGQLCRAARRKAASSSGRLLHGLGSSRLGLEPEGHSTQCQACCEGTQQTAPIGTSSRADCHLQLHDGGSCWACVLKHLPKCAVCFPDHELSRSGGCCWVGTPDCVSSMCRCAIACWENMPARVQGHAEPAACMP